jgi:hypothetical protein
MPSDAVLQESDNGVAFSISDRFRKFALRDLKVAGGRTIKTQGSAATGDVAGTDPKERTLADLAACAGDSGRNIV